MGQKINPIIFRITANKNSSWQSVWYSNKKTFAQKLLEDIKIRKVINQTLSRTGLGKIIIERISNKINVIIHSSKPGLIIGKKGSDITHLRNLLSDITESNVNINIAEIKKPETDALLLARHISLQLEKRVSFRKVAKKSVTAAMKMGVKGIRINIKGRIGGSDIARVEWYREGSVPLHTIRANIDYSHAPAHTNDGIVGVKVWIYKEDKKRKLPNKFLDRNTNVTTKKK